MPQENLQEQIFFDFFLFDMKEIMKYDMLQLCIVPDQISFDKCIMHYIRSNLSKLIWLGNIVPGQVKYKATRRRVL